MEGTMPPKATPPLLLLLLLLAAMGASVRARLLDWDLASLGPRFTPAWGTTLKVPSTFAVAWDLSFAKDTR